MRPLVCLVVVLICGCAKDPCGNVTDGFTIHAIRVPQGAQLDWTAVPADNYQIWAVDAASNPVATVTTKSVALTWPVNLGDLTFEVHPSIQRRLCPAAGWMVVPTAPALMAEPGDAGMQLSWTADPLLDGGTKLGRNLDGGSSFDVIATPVGTSYLDEHVTDGTHYTYLLQMHGPNVDAYSASIATETLQPPPLVTVIEYVDGIGLNITPAGDSGTCRVTLVSPPGLPTDTINLPQHPIEWKCPPNTDCTYAVQCGYPPGRPAFVTARLAPAAPTNCVAFPAVNGVHVQWTPPDSSVKSAVFRETPAGEVALGSTMGASFFDSTSPLFSSVT